MSGDIKQAKARLSIPQLWAMLGLPGTPAKSCRSPFRDDKNPSFSVFDDGLQWKDHGTGDHGDAIDFLARARGLSPGAAIAEFKRRAGVDGRPPTRHEKAEAVLDWQACVDGFTPEAGGKLAHWRGYSQDFVLWLHANKVVGTYNGHDAFAVRDGAGKVLGCHYRVPDGSWRYARKGLRVHPLVFGAVGRADRILAFESQWDAFAVMDRLGWHTGDGLGDTAVFVTRGAPNAKLIADRCSAAAAVFAFVQNDPAGERWLADLAAFARAVRVVTPAPHKDVNDWTRAGATAEHIEAAMHDAQPVEPPARMESVVSFDSVTARVRGEILAAVLDKDAAPASKRDRVARVVVDALRKVGRFYYHADLRDFDSAMFFDSHRKRLERVRADSFAAWLSEWLRINRADPLFKSILAAVETETLSGPGTVGIVPESFWAARPDSLYLSCGDGRMFRITGGGVEQVDNGTDAVLFAAGRTLTPWKLVDPRDPFELCTLLRSSHCSAAYGQDLLRLWLYSLPTIPRSKPPLCLTGDVGSGKTRTAKGFAELYGLPFLAHKVEEKGESQFWPCVDQGGIFTLDNADTRTRWLADAIATAATDGCSEQRRLYTNRETVTLRPRAWLAITTANPSFANDAGLADRLLVVRMARGEEETSDGKLTDEILSARDSALSHIALTLQKAQADTSPTPPRLNARHPDFAAFAVRIGRALGREAEAIAALRAAEQDKATFCVENDAIAAALLAYLRQARRFVGTAAQLVPRLVEADADLEGKLSAKRAGKQICALWPHLQKVLGRAEKKKDGHGYTVFDLEATGVADGGD